MIGPYDFFPLPVCEDHKINNNNKNNENEKLHSTSTVVDPKSHRSTKIPQLSMTSEVLSCARELQSKLSPSSKSLTKSKVSKQKSCKKKYKFVNYIPVSPPSSFDMQSSDDKSVDEISGIMSLFISSLNDSKQGGSGDEISTPKSAVQLDSVSTKVDSVSGDEQSASTSSSKSDSEKAIPSCVVVNGISYYSQPFKAPVQETEDSATPSNILVKEEKNLNSFKESIDSTSSLIASSPKEEEKNPRKTNSRDDLKCSNCEAVKTAVWRRDFQKRKCLCNACGLYLKLHKKARPADIIAKSGSKTNAPKRRNRKKKLAKEASSMIHSTSEQHILVDNIKANILQKSLSMSEQPMDIYSNGFGGYNQHHKQIMRSNSCGMPSNVDSLVNNADGLNFHSYSLPDFLNNMSSFINESSVGYQPNFFPLSGIPNYNLMANFIVKDCFTNGGNVVSSPDSCSMTDSDNQECNEIDMLINIDMLAEC